MNALGVDHVELLGLLPLLHGAGMDVLWPWTVQVDHDDSTRTLFWFAQGGLGLPDREAYVDGSDAAVALRSGSVDAALVRSWRLLLDHAPLTRSS